VFYGKTVYASDTDKIKITEEVDRIMNYYIYEVDKNNMKPNDFLIVTPFVKENPLVEALHISIREFWKNKNKNDDYKCYSVFHKSDTGSSIDLNESIDSTRIVSIHASKGDGRNVVFVIGVTENGLKQVAKNDNSENLSYNSFLHVALTRMIKKIYFRAESNNDKIDENLKLYLKENFECVEPKIKLSKIIKNDNFAQHDENFEECLLNIIKFTNYQILSEEKQEKEIIDLKHHCIRYASFQILLLIQIMNDKIESKDKEDPLQTQQLYQIWFKCINKTIIEFKLVKDYNISLWQKL
jgi:ATP-dependent exoDNAse (exonuclease V) beta subunit